MREPYWMINSECVFETRKNNKSLLWLIWIWLRMNWYYFIQLNFKKCNIRSYKGHIWGERMICLRCKRSKWDIDRMCRGVRI